MRSLILLIVLLAAVPAVPADQSDDRLVEVPTRPGVTVPVYLMKRSEAVATVVLLPGGNGGIALSGDEPSSRDFLVKNREYFSLQGFNVAVIGRPSDKLNLDLPARRSPDHLTDIRRIVAYLRNDSPLPVWLVGMSRGTVSATAAAIAFGSEDLAGIVLASSITSTTIPYTVPRQRLSRIRIPVLVLHHEKDACGICDPDGVREIMAGLTNVPVAKAVLVGGGWLPSGNPCTSSHWHGYSGMEREAVDIIARWIRDPAWW